MIPVLGILGELSISFYYYRPAAVNADKYWETCTRHPNDTVTCVM